MDARRFEHHGHALRRGRHSLSGQIYLITTVTWQRQLLFTDFSCARALIACMRAEQQRGAIDSLCWVIMPEHIHWLLQLQHQSLAAVMQHFKSRSALRINQHLQRQGRVWQPGYHDRAIRHDEDLQGIAHYIVANPLRAGLAQRAGDWSHWDAIWL